MIRTYIIALILLGFCVSTVNAQQHLIIAKMKDGSTYIGQKISEVDSIITIKITVGETISFSRFAAREVLDHDNAITLPQGKFHRLTGRFFSYQFGINPILFEEQNRISTHMEFSYLWRLTPRLNIGPAIGFEFNEAVVGGFTFNTTFSSLGVVSRYYLTNSKRRLYSFGRIAYGFPEESEEDNIAAEHTRGANLVAGIGIQFPVKRKSSFHINLGQYIQKTEGTEFFLDNLGNEIKTDFDILIKRLILKFSWDFK